MGTRFYLKSAWFLGLAPLVVGMTIFVAWVFWRIDVLMSAGMVTILVGLGSVALGIACTAVYAIRLWRSGPALHRRLLWQGVALLSLYVANFVVAGSIVVGVIAIQTCYTVSIVNQSSLPLTDVQITGGGVQVQVGDIAPGQTAKESFWIKHDGELILQARHGSDKIDTPIEGYVTHNMGGNKLVTLTASNQVKVQSRPPGLRQR